MFLQQVGKPFLLLLLHFTVPGRIKIHFTFLTLYFNLIAADSSLCSSRTVLVR
jgi:hypothetical protein